MITKIYHNKKFGLIEDENTGEKVTFQINDNNSLLYTHSKGNIFHIEEKYQNLEDLLKDGAISELAKWLARGMLGIPLNPDSKL